MRNIPDVWLSAMMLQKVKFRMAQMMAIQDVGSVSVSVSGRDGFGRNVMFRESFQSAQ